MRFRDEDVAIQWLGRESVTRAIRLYWHGGAHAVGNFGDALSPEIVRLLSEREVGYAPRQRADLIAIGSILEGVEARGWRRRLRLDFSPIRVWGSGFVDDGAPGAHKLFEFHLVRGPRTRRRIDPSETLPMGDPGLIADALLGDPPEKRHRWGVVPHLSHRDRPEIDRFVAETAGARRIDLRGDPIAILREIAACERVVSSSLHGLIAADAFHIPNHRLKFDPPLRGDDYKFFDYFESVGREIAWREGADLPPDLDDAFGRDVASLAYADMIERRKRDIKASFPEPLRA